MKRLNGAFGRILVLAVPFVAAWVCAPRLTLEQFELPKHVAIGLIAAWFLCLHGAGGLRAHPPLAGLLAAFILSTIASVAPIPSALGEHENLEGLLTWLLYAMLFLAGSGSLSRAVAAPGRLHAAILAAAAGSAGYALLQQAGFDPFRGEYFRHVRSFAGNPDFLASQMAMALPLAVGASIQGGRPWGPKPSAVSALAAVFLLVLALTGSRAGMAAGLAGVVLLLYWSRKAPSVRRQAPVLAILAAGALLVSGLISAPEISLPARIDALLAGGGLAGSRGSIWAGSARAARIRPVAGWGPDTLKAVFLVSAPAGWASREGLGVTARRAHCELLHILASAGVLGTGAYLWLLAYALKRFLAAGRDPCLDASAASVAAYLAHGAFGFGTSSTAPVFWLLLGTICPARAGAGAARSPVSGSPRSADPGSGYRTAAALILACFAAVRLLADGHAYRGNEAGRRGNRAEEERAFLAAARLAPWEPVYLTRRAWALEQLGRREEALPLYGNAFALMPVDGIKLGHVGRLRFALAAGEQEREAAFAQLVRAVEMAPSQPSLYAAAIAAAQRIGASDERERLARRLRDRDPGWAAKLLGP